VLGVADADLLFGAWSDRRRRRAGRAAGGDRLNESAATRPSSCATSRATRATCRRVHAGREVPAELSVSPERDARLADRRRACRAARRAAARPARRRDGHGFKDGGEARAQLELALVKAASPDIDPSTRALLARVEKLEAALAGRAPAPASAPPVAAPPRRPPSRHAAARPGARGQRSAPPSPRRAGARPAAGHRDRHAARPRLAACATCGPRSSRTSAVPQRARRRRAPARPPRSSCATAELVIAYGPARRFLAGQVKSAEFRDIVAEALRTVTGAPAAPSYELREPEPRRAAIEPTEDSGSTGSRRLRRGGDLLRGAPKLMPQPNMQQMLKQVQKMQET